MAKREGSGSGNLRFARPTVAEKLWDGSLQLNSSVTVSVVAFFKSGEKMPDIKWSELVQVKGKVRLEAFEKYIQELARSRNRGLMGQKPEVKTGGSPIDVFFALLISSLNSQVVSLCWKEGSSKSGLAGLKEIAKGYEKGERVGFAQLSPGIDLYICPCSDAIITILAKHGFFKGMAAVENKQNSLVGCVVWRRNHGPSNSVTRKLERKHSSLTEQPLNSHSEQKLLENDLPCTQPAQESHLATCTSIGSAIINRNEGDNVFINDIQLELHNSPASANLLLTTSALSNLSSTSEGLQTSSCSNSVSLFGPKEQSSERGMSLTDNAGTEKPKSGLGLQNPVLSLPSVITKVHTPAIDDDDLPEFDFGAACGISESLRNKVLDTAVFDKNVFVEGLKKIVGSLPLTLPTIQSLPAPHKRRAENFLLPEFPYDAILNLPPGKKVCEHDQVSMLPALEMKQTTKSGTTFTPVITTIVAPQKNIFDDDDDDMPEWCPPNVELLKHTFLEPAKVVASVYPTLSNSKSSSSPGHPSPSFCSLATQLPFSTRRSNYRNHWPIIASVKPAQRRQTDGYIQRAPSSLMDSNSSDLLRPPLHTPGWRGRGR